MQVERNCKSLLLKIAAIPPGAANVVCRDAAYLCVYAKVVVNKF